MLQLFDPIVTGKIVDLECYMSQPSQKVAVLLVTAYMLSILYFDSVT